MLFKKPSRFKDLLVQSVKMSHESLEEQSELNFDYKKDKEYFGDLMNNNNGHGPYAFS